MAEIRIARRFRGPQTTGNGGYTSGAVAAFVRAPAAEVTLRRPPPLERPLRVQERDGRVEVLDATLVVAEGVPAHLDLEPPRAASVGEARSAEAHSVGAGEHPFPECFVCGPARRPGDGLRLRPGRVGEERLVAAFWMPHESLAADDGVVRPEFVWAALDCPGAFAVELVGRGTRVLGRLAARVDRRPQVGEELVVLGWPLGGDGRKQEAGTAILDASGRTLAVARAVWIEPR